MRFNLNKGHSAQAKPYRRSSVHESNRICQSFCFSVNIIFSELSNWNILQNSELQQGHWKLQESYDLSVTMWNQFPQCKWVGLCFCEVNSLLFFKRIVDQQLKMSPTDVFKVFFYLPKCISLQVGIDLIISSWIIHIELLGYFDTIKCFSTWYSIRKACLQTWKYRITRFEITCIYIYRVGHFFLFP